MEGKISSPQRRSYSLSRRLSRRQVWHWNSEGPVQWRHLAWQASHACASLSQYSMAAHSAWGTQPPWLFTLRPSWHVVQAPEDEQVRQDLWQSAGGMGTDTRERVRSPLEGISSLKSVLAVLAQRFLGPCVKGVGSGVGLSRVEHSCCQMRKKMSGSLSLQSPGSPFLQQPPQRC